MINTLQLNCNHLIIHAPNIHTGGGRTLLLALLSDLKTTQQGILIIDQRFELPDNIPAAFSIKQISATFWGRFKAELLLKQLATPQSNVLCFGNLPPLFKLSAKTSVFFQNRLLLKGEPIVGFNLWTHSRIIIERHWFKWFSSHADEIITQTQSMQIATQKQLNHPNVSIATLLPNMNTLKTKPQQAIYDFIYVTNNLPHKNNEKLIEAWCLLAKEGLFPSLHLTLDNNKHIEKMKTYYKLNIQCLGKLPHKQLLESYQNYRALIFPSLCETIALPLIEAKNAGIAVLVSDLDYAQAIIVPDELFNPTSAVSIMKAVKNFINQRRFPILNI